MGGVQKHSPETYKRARELREKHGLTFEEISRRLSIPVSTLKDHARWNKWSKSPLAAAKEMDPDDPKVKMIEELERKVQSARADKARLATLYRSLQDDYEILQRRTGLIDQVGLPVIEPIKKKAPTGGETEAAAFLVASDWHLEEEVKPETVNGLNTYNLEISRKRAERFFRSGLRLTEIIDRDINITTIVLPLLGDFITNDIHEENREVNALLPFEAIQMAQNCIASGIQFLLDNSQYNLVIPCHSGNHGRTTKRVFVSTEHGHSLEYFMYKNLETLFSKSERVKFHITPAYHSYLDVFGVTVRFHHGHATYYQGGVGGIYIPVNKSIAQWNKAKHADLDIFGHFHQMKDGGNFLSNGSLIGYNAYALRIKADFEPPRQVFTVIDEKRGRTFTCPIVVDDAAK